MANDKPNPPTAETHPTATHPTGQPRTGQMPVGQHDAAAQHAAAQSAAAQREETNKRNREELERSREQRANRPQDMAFGGKPTPTQAENDELRMGLRDIDDKEPSGSPPDYGEALDEFRRTFHDDYHKKASGNKAR